MKQETRSPATDQKTESLIVRKTAQHEAGHKKSGGAVDFTTFRRAFFLAEKAWRRSAVWKKDIGGYTGILPNGKEDPWLRKDAEGLEDALDAILSGPDRDRPERREMAAISVLKIPNENGHESKGISNYGGGSNNKFDGPEYGFSIAVIRCDARSRIISGLSLDTNTPGWRDILANYRDWVHDGPILGAAEGNNQRAAIGAILAAAGIGKGRLSILEVPALDDTQDAPGTIKGVEVLRSGIPRFRSAMAEALRAILVERATHTRNHISVKQGSYTAFAVQAMEAGGVDQDIIARTLGVDARLVSAFSSKGKTGFVEEKWLDTKNALRQGAPTLDGLTGIQKNAGWSVWKGAGFYAGQQERRIRILAEARKMIGAGAALPEVAHKLHLRRRTLVDMISMSMADAKREREDFFKALVRPEDFASLAYRDT